MEIALSHFLAFSVLSVGAIFDLKTTEVPDTLNIVGVVGGILLHAYATFSMISFSTLSNFSLLLSSPVQWLQAIGDPLFWCLGVGLVFSIYGWGLYFLGMWGGADAFAMSVLGFAAPYSLNGISIIYPASLFTAVLLAGFIYTLLFGFWKSWKNKEMYRKTWEQIKSDEKRISMEIVLAAVLSSITIYTDAKLGAIYFVMFVILIFLYRFFQNIQDDLMVEKVPVKDLEGGEVLAKEEALGGKVKGLTEEDIGKLDKEYVKIRSGIKFVPVFPIALFLVDVVGFKITWLFIVLS